MSDKIYGGYWGKLKVYGWVDHAYTEELERDFPAWAREHPHSTQTRVFVAAHSQAQAARWARVKSPARLWNLSETGNVIQCGVALNQPGVVFYRPLDAGDTVPYIERKPRT